MAVPFLSIAYIACMSRFPRHLDPQCRPTPMWNAVSPGPNGTLHGFSALCWYTGKEMFERLGGDVPVGLIAGSVGGSPIELWLPPGDVNISSACGVDDPPCDNQHNLSDSLFYNEFIQPFEPFVTHFNDSSSRMLHYTGIHV